MRVTLILIIAALISTCSSAPPLLDQILETGELRVVTRDSPTSYVVSPDGISGPEYDLVRAFADELGVELVFIRPPVLLGPGDHRFRSTSNIIRMLRGRLPFLIQGGMHFIDIRDAMHAIWCAMERPDVRPVYHLAGTSSTWPPRGVCAASWPSSIWAPSTC